MNGLIRFNPSTEMRRLQNEFDRLFEDLFPSRGSEAGDPASALWSPRVDVGETEEAYLLHVDVPGMKKEDIEISYHEGNLTICGERKAETTEQKPSYMRAERLYGRFYRSFALPKQVNADQIEATYQDGVLNVLVPKAEETKPRKIQVS